MEHFLLQLDWPESILLIVCVIVVGYILNVFMRGMVGGLDGIVYIKEPCDKKHVD